MDFWIFLGVALDSSGGYIPDIVSESGCTNFFSGLEVVDIFNKKIKLENLQQSIKRLIIIPKLRI